MAYHLPAALDEAIKLHEATLKHLEANLGPDNPYTNMSRINLVNAYESLGR